MKLEKLRNFVLLQFAKRQNRKFRILRNTKLEKYLVWFILILKPFKIGFHGCNEESVNEKPERKLKKQKIYICHHFEIPAQPKKNLARISVFRTRTLIQQLTDNSRLLQSAIPNIMADFAHYGPLLSLQKNREALRGRERWIIGKWR